MKAEQQPVVLGACDWCGKDAYQRLTLQEGRNTTRAIRMARYALVCPDHYRHFHMMDEVGDGRAQPGW